jgi:hypothetical protein
MADLNDTVAARDLEMRDLNWFCDRMRAGSTVVLLESGRIEVRLRGQEPATFDSARAAWHHLKALRAVDHGRAKELRDRTDERTKAARFDMLTALVAVDDASALLATGVRGLDQSSANRAMAARLLEAAGRVSEALKAWEAAERLGLAAEHGKGHCRHSGADFEGLELLPLEADLSCPQCGFWMPDAGG